MAKEVIKNTPIGEIRIRKFKNYGYLVYIKCIDTYKDFKSLSILERFINATKGLKPYQICCKHRKVSNCLKCCRYDTCTLKDIS